MYGLLNKEEKKGRDAWGERGGGCDGMRERKFVEIALPS